MHAQASALVLLSRGPSRVSCSPLPSTLGCLFLPQSNHTCFSNFLSGYFIAIPLEKGLDYCRLYSEFHLPIFVRKVFPDYYPVFGVSSTAARLSHAITIPVHKAVSLASDRGRLSSRLEGLIAFFHLDFRKCFS